MHASGVAISDRAIQFVEFSYKKRTELESFGEIILPDKSLDGGGITNPDLFAKSLKELRDKHLDLFTKSEKLNNSMVTQNRKLQT